MTRNWPRWVWLSTSFNSQWWITTNELTKDQIFAYKFASIVTNFEAKISLAISCFSWHKNGGFSIHKSLHPLRSTMFFCRQYSVFVGAINSNPQKSISNKIKLGLLGTQHNLDKKEGKLLIGIMPCLLQSYNVCDLISDFVLFYLWWFSKKFNEPDFHDDIYFSLFGIIIIIGMLLSLFTLITCLIKYYMIIRTKHGLHGC